MTETLTLATQFGPGVFVLVLLIVLLVKLRDRVGSRIDESVEEWVDRLERELRDERDRNRRREAAREVLDAAHRAWDTAALRAAIRGDTAALEAMPDPPPLTPHPSMYELDPKEAQR